jgi:hypothetical protein
MAEVGEREVMLGQLRSLTAMKSVKVDIVDMHDIPNGDFSSDRRSVAWNRTFNRVIFLQTDVGDRGTDWRVVDGSESFSRTRRGIIFQIVNAVFSIALSLVVCKLIASTRQTSGTENETESGAYT